MFLNWYFEKSHNKAKPQNTKGFSQNSQILNDININSLAT